MKRLLVWLSLSLLLLSAGCAQEAPDQASWPLRVAVILPHNDDSYFHDMAESASAHARELGIDIKVSWPQLNYNIPQITELIREATAAQVDAIITQGAEVPSYQAALEEAARAGIQVVLVDTDIAGGSDYFYVGTDNVEAGRILGRELVRVTGGLTFSRVLTPETCPVEHILAFDLTSDSVGGIRAGLLDGVVAQDQRQMGIIALDEVLRFAREGHYSGAVHYTDSFFVSAENLDEALSKAAGNEK